MSRALSQLAFLSHHHHYRRRVLPSPSLPCTSRPCPWYTHRYRFKALSLPILCPSTLTAMKGFRNWFTAVLWVFALAVAMNTLSVKPGALCVRFFVACRLLTRSWALALLNARLVRRSKKRSQVSTHSRISHMAPRKSNSANCMSSRGSALTPAPAVLSSESRLRPRQRRQ